METRTVCFDLPVGAFSALRKTPDEFKKDMRIIAAVKWYEMGQISQENAAEIAGISGGLFNEIGQSKRISISVHS